MWLLHALALIIERLYRHVTCIVARIHGLAPYNSVACFASTYPYRFPPDSS